jgi:phosphoserine phosphatase RsbU/P
MVIAYSIFGKRTGIQMVSESGFPAIFNNNDEIIFHPLLNTPYQSLIETLPQRVKQQIPAKYKRSDKINLPGGIILQNLKPYADKEKYLTFLIYDENLQWYITINQPYSALYKDLYVYFKQTGWWFLFMVVILLAAMVFINWSQLKPAIEIANQLKESPHLERRFLPEGNELTVIRKGFDLLQNQLNQYIKSFEKNAIDRSKLERDLQVAKKLQRSVLPAGNLPVNNHPNIEIFAVSESAFDIGGDLYDYFMIDDEHLLFVVGDVAGKGIPASLFMIFTHTLLRSVAKQGMSTNEIVATLNDKLIEENISDLFVTLFLGIVNINSGSFSFCNAAHCAPFLIHGKGELEELAETHGIPIGIYAKREYKQSTINLLPNDMMFVYTDGVVDAKDENGMNFSNEVLRFNLMGTWFKSCEDTVNKIKESVDSFRGNVNPEDDITLLALKFKGSNTDSVV